MGKLSDARCGSLLKVTGDRSRLGLAIVAFVELRPKSIDLEIG